MLAVCLVYQKRTQPPRVDACPADGAFRVGGASADKVQYMRMWLDPEVRQRCDLKKNPTNQQANSSVLEVRERATTSSPSCAPSLWKPTEHLQMWFACTCFGHRPKHLNHLIRASNYAVEEETLRPHVVMA